MAIVMGLDQHRRRSRLSGSTPTAARFGPRRVAPGATVDVLRGSCRRFAGGELEVALEATTGWRFVVEELQRIGAEVASGRAGRDVALRGTATTRQDRPGATPGSARAADGAAGCPSRGSRPAHLLDLRARVRLRHTLVDQRGEWLQRIHAVLFHHGVPQAGLGLLDGRRTDALA